MRAYSNGRNPAEVTSGMRRSFAVFSDSFLNNFYFFENSLALFFREGDSPLFHDVSEMSVDRPTERLEVRK